MRLAIALALLIILAVLLASPAPNPCWPSARSVTHLFAPAATDECRYGHRAGDRRETQ